MPERVAVCVATFRRPAGLARLLDGLRDQKLGAGTGASFEVFVADNDPEGSGRAVCAGRDGVCYDVEPRRGIPQARNLCLEKARSWGATHAAFIDDDEEPAPDWLDQLLAASRRFRADVVQGRVVARFTTPPPEWILRDSLFDRVTGETGDALPFAATNATLCSMAVFDAVGGFEETWALSGGTDTLLFAKATAAGFRAVWCDEAVVSEEIGPDRANLSWLLRRALRVGITQSRVKRALAQNKGPAASQVALGLKLAAGGLWRALPWTASPYTRPMSLRMAALGAGIALGALGADYAEYASR